MARTRLSIVEKVKIEALLDFTIKEMRSGRGGFSAEYSVSESAKLESILRKIESARNLWLET